MSVSHFKSRCKAKSTAKLEAIATNHTYTNDARTAATQLLTERHPTSTAITAFSQYQQAQQNAETLKRATINQNLAVINIGKKRVTGLKMATCLL